MVRAQTCIHMNSFTYEPTYLQKSGSRFSYKPDNSPIPILSKKKMSAWRLPNCVAKFLQQYVYIYIFMYVFI